MSGKPGYGGSDGRPPAEIYLGCTEGQWPIQAFSEASHAPGWLTGQQDGRRRHLWKVTLGTMTEMTATLPVPARLVAKEQE